MGKPITDEQRQQIVQKHVPDTLKLYLEGKSEQFWLRENKPGVILLMNGASVDQTKATVQALPLAANVFLGLEVHSGRLAYAAGLADPG
jgi:hypothetical protein